MKRNHEVAVGIAVLAGIALIIFGIIFLQGMRLGAEDVEVQARFREVGQLLEGGTVKLRGVPIGRVEAIELEPSGNGVLVTLSVRSDVRLPPDPAVVISPESLFGDWQAEVVARNTFGYDFAESPDPAVLPGYALPDMSRLTAVADEIASNLATISTRVELAFTQETADNIRLAINNIQHLSEQLNDIVGAQQGALEEVAANLRSTSVAADEAAEGDAGGDRAQDAAGPRRHRLRGWRWRR